MCWALLFAPLLQAFDAEISHDHDGKKKKLRKKKEKVRGEKRSEKRAASLYRLLFITAYPICSQHRLGRGLRLINSIGRCEKSKFIIGLCVYNV